jgi:hypothetical protein
MGSLILYVLIIVIASAAAFYFYQSRLRTIGAGVILICLGIYWLYLKMVPGRLLPEITGTLALYAGWITVICGILLIILSGKKQ